MSDSHSDFAIRTDDVTKRYGTVTALQGIDLRVRRGEAFGFLGPNGAGKTTTIDILLDLARPTAGRATVLGHDPQVEPDEVRSRVGVLPQGYALFDRRTGKQHVRFAVESADGTESVDGLLDRVGLGSEDAARPAGTYSTGMRQRLALAMALAGDPDLLILDEPAAGLDPTGVRELQELVRDEIDRGTTVFFSSHVLAHVEAVCDRVGILRDGRLVAVDAVDTLRETAGLGSRLVLKVDRVPDIELSVLDGIAESIAENGRLEVTCAHPSAKVDVVARLLDADVTIHDLVTEEPTLADVFAVFAGENADPRNVLEPGREVLA